MTTKKLFLDTLTFSLPKEPVNCYFSTDDDAKHQSAIIKSASVAPTEVRHSPKFIDLFAGSGDFRLFTTFDKITESFEAIPIDFSDGGNEFFVKRFYNRHLFGYFRQFDDVVVTKSGITNDIQVWVRDESMTRSITYYGKRHELWQMDRFTLRVRFDNFNDTPYLLVACDRPALVPSATLKTLFSEMPDDPFGDNDSITPDMINYVMTREVKKDANGKERTIRIIDKLEYLQSHNRYCPFEATRPVMSGKLKAFFGLVGNSEPRSTESKYIKYRDKIEAFRQRFLDSESLSSLLPDLAHTFTEVNPLQVGSSNEAKRQLVFGKDTQGCDHKNISQQKGINCGPHIKCPYSDVRLIFVLPKSSSDETKALAKNLINGNYQGKSKPLSHFTGSPIGFAGKDFHIVFENEKNPVPEIERALQRECYRNLPTQTKFVAIYVSPIHKYASLHHAKECYYKIKELFLKYGIPSQCIDRDKMNEAIARDTKNNKYNFAYTLQNMGIAICAKLGGSPWLLDEVEKKELVIGIGAFRSENHQYIGAAFSFDNTGVFNDYHYFEKSELNELVGAIRLAIINYASVNSQPDRIIIHYYKKISRKNEFSRIEEMLKNLKLDVPVYIVSINKTESEDIVVFDAENSEHLMPYSGTWVNLGPSKDGHRFLLCNNTRYEGEKFNAMDGFPFPVKLTISCPNRNDEIETPVIMQLIDQVYQFSRIYWKSTKQQGLPVTIKYPEMIAEIMPHFDDKTVYVKSNALWFL